MQDRIQLKREEIVGDGVALSDINPITNTKSVDDESAGVPLSITIEKMWQAINNTLSRIVNSVNGRDGVVVITAADVGLGNVTNVSFSTIKDWVIDELAAEFGIKRLMLFDTIADLSLEMESWSHDKGHANIPFYIKSYSNSDRKSYIGYTYWDTAENIIALSMLPINVVGYTDASLIYDESVNGKDLRGGGLGVNIRNGEDALKLYEESASKAMNGLYIDKSKIAPDVFFFDGVYGATGDGGSTDGLLYVDDGQSSNTKDILIKINGNEIGTAKTAQTFKVNDLILTSFSDENYRDAEGTLKQNLDADYVCRESCIGRVTTVYDATVEGSKYTVEFFTIKPYVGMGLKYYDTHTSSMDVQSSMIGIDLIHGKIDSNNVTDNISGLNAFNNASFENPKIAISKEHYTVTPIGETHNTLRKSNGAFVAPDFSLNVIPYNSFTDNNSPITNWPVSVPTVSPSLTTESFLGINLLKKMSASGKNAYNMSGLRIIKDSEAITNALLGKSDNDTSDNLSAPIDGSGDMSSSGGLAVNVGNFLEIGTNVGDDALVKPVSGYYDGGKINVRVDEFSLGDTGDNKLGVKISKIESLRQLPWFNQLGGGLTTTEGVDGALKITPGLTINKGLGMRMSKFNRFGVNVYEGISNSTPGYYHENVFYETYDGETYSDPITPTNFGFYYDRISQKNYCYEINQYVVVDKNYGFVTPSIFDVNFSDPDVNTHTIARSLYGGLRYITPGSSSDYVSSIGLRVNSRENVPRLGSAAVGISNDNVVGVQLYRESKTYTNPLEIKNADENSIAPHIYFKGWVTQEYPSVESFPVNGENEVIYFDADKKKRYVWNASESTYEPMYQYYPSYASLPNPGETNKVYVVEAINEGTMEIVVSAYTWRVPEIVDFPLLHSPVTAVQASQILAVYAAEQTAIQGYLNNGIFYSDPNYIHRIDYVDGKRYTDMTERPEDMYNGRYYHVTYEAHYNSSTLTYEISPILDLTSQLLGTLDITHDGNVNAVDASGVLKYYALNGTGDGYIRPGETALQAWQRFIKEEYGIISSDEAGDPCYVRQFSTAEDGSFMPGLDINLNEFQGITSSTSGQFKPSVSVKIYDYSNGTKSTDPDFDEAFSPYYNGGLRFNTDGFLGVRVNENSEYDSTTENGRQQFDSTGSGSKGLRIYSNNVLGVRLSKYQDVTDNGELCIDEEGNLKISPNYSGGGGGGGELLTITDGTNNIEYNGTSPVTITLGPGLILVPDPEPTDEP